MSVLLQWQDAKLGDVLTLKRGYDLPHRERRAGDIPIISSSGITDFHDTAKVKGPGVVTGRYGTLGEIFFVENDYWPLNTSLYVQNFKGNHPRFISYFLRTLNFATQNVAGAVPGVNRNFLHMMPVKLPPLETQRQIAAVLSAYDDLIENNRGRIKVLEEMAGLVYREWFVNFRFPGHQGVRRVASELGEIPEGWRAAKLGDIAEQVRRNVQPSEVSKETPYIGLEHLPRKSIALSEWAFPDSVTSSKLRFYQGEILFGKIRPYFHKVGVAPVNGICSSDIIVIRPKTPEFAAFTAMVTSSENFVLQSVQTSQGTKMPRANWDVLIKYPVFLPDSALLERFNGIAANIISQIKNLIFKNQNLRWTRDLLLPKLISGELDLAKRPLENEVVGV